MTIELTGTTSGSVETLTPRQIKDTFIDAFVVLPENEYEGQFCERPCSPKKVPVVVFMHGSSGITEPVKEFGRALAKEGFAFFAPNSMTTPDRLTYTSPVARETYEKIHAMRAQELKYAIEHLHELPFFNGEYVIAGTSEGGVAVARCEAKCETGEEKGRMIFSWSCEDNYHVVSHQTNIPETVPVLNVMSATDKFFSLANSYLDNNEALGNASRTLKDHPDCTVVLLPGAPHTLFNLPSAQSMIVAFLKRVFH